MSAIFSAKARRTMTASSKARGLALTRALRWRLSHRAIM